MEAVAHVGALAFPCPCASSGDGMGGGEVWLLPLPGNSVALFKFCLELGQRRTTEAEPRKAGCPEKSQGESVGWAQIADGEGRSGSREMPGMEGGSNWPRMALALSLPFSPLSPPSFSPSLSSSLPSSHHTSLLVPVIALICMSGKALLHTQKENPSRGGVAVSALAVVRQCKIKLIKPPTQENITGN